MKSKNVIVQVFLEAKTAAQGTNAAEATQVEELDNGNFHVTLPCAELQLLAPFIATSAQMKTMTDDLRKQVMGQA